MSTVLDFIQRIYKVLHPPGVQTHSDSGLIKFGILGAANIAPAALISPATNHPEVEIYAVAARNQKKALDFGTKYGIPRVYGGENAYQALLDDTEVQVVYNPLPNRLHYEWTMRALAAGKHLTDTAEETKAMFELAERKGLVLLEALHYRFHPAIQRVKAILDSGELGAIKSLTVNLAVPNVISDSDIQFNYDLGGGALMGMGCYNLSCIRYLTSSEPISVLSASHVPHVPSSSPADFVSNIDLGTTATLSFPNDVVATLNCSFIPQMPQCDFTVECEGGNVTMFNFVLPTYYHSIKVYIRDKKTRVEKVYSFADAGIDAKGEKWWMTYRYQLEAFVDRVKGRNPQAWVDMQHSVANMEWIEKIYAKTGLGSRPKSSYTLS
ncbi:NAD(P)-binding protein [Tricholoma matsutake]|nr:NAD(P)-binding protein [Tricholoma matsutake 945]